MNMDECLLWLDENLPLEYSTEDLAAAYDALSKADRFRGRILRQQHWRFLVYIAALATAGISAAKSKVKGGFTRYKPTSRLLKLWIAKTRYAEKKEKATQLAAIMHCSQKKALAELPYLELALK